MRQRISCLCTQRLKPGMHLAQALHRADGAILMPEGTEITETVLAQLQQRGIEYVVASLDDNRDEATITKELELALDEREELLVEGGLAKPRVLSHGGHRVLDLLLQEVQRDGFLGAKVVEDRAFGDAGLPRNRAGGGGVEALRLEQLQRDGHDAGLGRGFLPGPVPRGPWPLASARTRRLVARHLKL